MMVVVAAALALSTVGCDRPGIFPTGDTPSEVSPVQTGSVSPIHTGSVSPVPDPRVLQQVFSDLGHDLPVRSGDTITDAGLVVRVTGDEEIHLVAVHPQIDEVVDGQVTVIGTYVHEISLDGFGSPYGIQRGYPPTLPPSELIPVAGAVLRHNDFPDVSYEVIIGLSVVGGTSHVSAISIDYEGSGGVATLTFRQDLTICVTPPGATDCRGA